MYKIRSFRYNKNTFIIIPITYCNKIKKYTMDIHKFCTRFLFSSDYLKGETNYPQLSLWYYQLNGVKKTKVICVTDI